MGVSVVTCCISLVPRPPPSFLSLAAGRGPGNEATVVQYKCYIGNVLAQVKHGSMVPWCPFRHDASILLTGSLTQQVETMVVAASGYLRLQVDCGYSQHIAKTSH